MLKKKRAILHCDKSVLWCQWDEKTILATGEIGKNIYRVGFVRKFDPKKPTPNMYVFKGDQLFNVDNPRLTFAFENTGKYGEPLAERIGDFIVYNVVTGTNSYVSVPFNEDGEVVQSKVRVGKL